MLTWLLKNNAMVNTKASSDFGSTKTHNNLRIKLMETPLSFEATLPWPPTVNSYWRHRVIGKLATVYVSADGQAYRKAVNLCLMEHGIKTYAIEGDLRVEIEVFPPDKRKRDIDNLNKSIFGLLRSPLIQL